MNSFVSNTSKNAAEALATFLREANRSVDAAIVSEESAEAGDMVVFGRFLL